MALPPDIVAALDLLRVICETEGEEKSLARLEAIHDEVQSMDAGVLNRAVSAEIEGLQGDIEDATIQGVYLVIACLILCAVEIWGALALKDATPVYGLIGGAGMAGMGHLIASAFPKTKPSSALEVVDPGADEVHAEIYSFLREVHGRSKTSVSFRHFEMLMSAIRHLRETRSELLVDRNRLTNKATRVLGRFAGGCLILWILGVAAVIIIEIVGGGSPVPAITFLGTSFLGIIKLGRKFGLRNSNDPVTP